MREEVNEFDKLLYEEIKGLRKDLRDHYNNHNNLEKRVAKIESKIILIGVIVGSVGYGSGELVKSLLKGFI